MNNVNSSVSILERRLQEQSCRTQKAKAGYSATYSPSLQRASSQLPDASPSAPTKAASPVPATGSVDELLAAVAIQATQEKAEAARCRRENEKAYREQCALEDTDQDAPTPDEIQFRNEQKRVQFELGQLVRGPPGAAREASLKALEEMKDTADERRRIQQLPERPRPTAGAWRKDAHRSEQPHGYLGAPSNAADAKASRSKSSGSAPPMSQSKLASRMSARPRLGFVPHEQAYRYKETPVAKALKEAAEQKELAAMQAAQQKEDDEEEAALMKRRQVRLEKGAREEEEASEEEAPADEEDHEVVDQEANNRESRIEELRQIEQQLRSDTYWAIVERKALEKLAEIKSKRLEHVQTQHSRATGGKVAWDSWLLLGLVEEEFKDIDVALAEVLVLEKQHHGFYTIDTSYRSTECKALEDFILRHNAPKDDIDHSWVEPSQSALKKYRYDKNGTGVHLTRHSMIVDPGSFWSHDLIKPRPTDWVAKEGMNGTPRDKWSSPVLNDQGMCEQAEWVEVEECMVRRRKEYVYTPGKQSFRDPITGSVTKFISDSE